MEKKSTTELIRTQSLVDIDNSVIKYIKEHIATPFEFNSRRVKPNVLYGKPERGMEQIAKSHYKVHIDGNHYNLPVISIYRVGEDIDHSMIPHWLGDEQLNFEIGRIFDKRYEKGNVKYLMERRPARVNLQYDIRVICASQAHKNILIEQFIINEGKSWGDGGNWASYPSISDASQSADQNSERLIVSNFIMTLTGYILPEISQNKKMDYTKIPTIKSVSISETVLSQDQLNNLLG